MEQIGLKAKKREFTKKKVKILRQQGILPAVLYGHEVKPINLSLNGKEFSEIFDKAGTSSLINLEIEGEKPIKILVHDLQIHPVTDKTMHVDFYQVKMTEKITTEIPLEFVGEAPAVKELEGNLITSKDEIEVECLPDALVPKIDVDISVLKTFDDLIHIKDLNVPSNIEVLDNPEEVVALVTPPRSEEELEEELKVEGEEAEKAAIGEMEAKAESEKAAEEAEKESEKTAEETVKEETK